MLVKTLRLLEIQTKTNIRYRYLQGITKNQDEVYKSRISHPVAFLVKGVLKICDIFTGEHRCEVRFH